MEASNVTESEHLDIFQTISIDKVIIPLFYTLIVVFGISGNCLVILVVIRNIYYRQSTIHVYISHLAVSDLLFLLFCLPVHTIIYVHYTWPFGDILCRAVHFIQFATMQASAAFAATMAADRYLAISRAIRARFGRKLFTAHVVAVVIWTLTFISAGPWLYFYKLETYRVNPITNTSLVTPFKACTFSFPNMLTKQSMFLATSLIGYALPTVLIIVFSSLLLYRLWIFEHPDCNQQFVRTKRRITALVFAISFTFLICWLPNHCCALFATFASRKLLEENVNVFINVRIAAHALSYANSCMNPIIYNFLSKNFRRGFANMLCRSCKSGALRSVSNQPRNRINMRRLQPNINNFI